MTYLSNADPLLAYLLEASLIFLPFLMIVFVPSSLTLWLDGYLKTIDNLFSRVCMICLWMVLLIGMTLTIAYLILGYESHYSTSHSKITFGLIAIALTFLVLHRWHLKGRASKKHNEVKVIIKSHGLSQMYLYLFWFMSVRELYLRIETFDTVEKIVFFHILVFAGFMASSRLYFNLHIIR